ncbi:dihydrofolate reductase family protein [Staphylococcus carnosus]|uniref:5-amino-6-(5-phosphoribosylamino)uracil reductase n=1 Tax=Staphylococcus carnosus TaxID=1281 RepID=A0AAJ0JPL5_STACA|nr:dihydrofolate reductase family protein [Staphylococcus carnosus]ANZ34308.1 5-amino-6-(5-phosphoribosylamino)uracil reductase [Staphylococcus carnosus]KKB25476.1 5-amino-6-(5-phosphoribosylamino)uracil reductase [Staphylococcus carnosus]KOR11888.1 5-amino-6-(5-phosphoribosylamino)uracil reductase [Staphylococcus carnosus]POA04688.1 5-amino-6-(5-phosphoribosylamino)uracil reductase [Staphylococcus carnosus]QQS86267.1 dihydrofolate reductase family protein [Staphylococcus carnosus]
MTRPKIILHMSESINGNITGPYNKVAGSNLGKAYEYADEKINSNAMILGRKTIEENFTSKEMPNLPEDPKSYSRNEDFVANTDLDHYVISIDPSGKAAWEQNYIKFRDRPKMHIIEVLSENVSDAYLEHLRNLNISYVFGGPNKKLDLKSVVSKLNQLFNLDKLTLSGGGGVNWSFFEQGLVDEISVIIAPVVDDHFNRPNLFDNNDKDQSDVIQKYKIHHVEQLDGDIVWLYYKI